VESEQAGSPIAATSQGDPADTPQRVDPSVKTEADLERESKRLRSGRRRDKMIGPALKTVPERRGELGKAAVPHAPDGTVAPIRMPTIGPVSQPIRPPAGSEKEALAVRPPAARAGVKRRHKMALYSFVLIVVLPVIVTAVYLFGFAQDQYASEAGFSVRKEEGATSVDMLGGLSAITGAASTDAEILYDFINSPDLVAQIDKDLDLHEIYGRNYTSDPLFSLKPGSNIEEKQDFWQSMVTVEYNESTGLIGLEVRAFSPEEAQKIGQAIIGYSSLMINRLAEAARDDATKYARKELARAGDRLKEVRVALTNYRSRNQVVDPLSDIQGQMGLMNRLEEQLADAMIERDILKSTASDTDPRVAQWERRIEVIKVSLAQERKKFGLGEEGVAGSGDYAQIVAEYEGLVVEREVAEEAFRSATLIFNAAQAEANRQSRYLAAHIEPTLAEGAIYPQFTLILVMTAFFLSLAWALATLVFYSIRDRR
jgi:capsular polysaccharide transport system permease protein